MKCPNCGKEIDEGSVFCTECGTKIEAAAQKMNYRPNMSARILSGGKSKVIGVMFNIVRDGFFTDLVQTIDRALRRHGYTGFYTFWGSVEEFQRSLEAMHQYNVAGILTGHDIPAEDILENEDGKLYLDSQLKKAIEVVKEN